METRELDFFKKQINSLATKALDKRVSLTNFLDETKQAIILNSHFKGITVDFASGFQGGEYKRAIFRPLASAFADFKIVVYEILYNERFLNLTHRKILGSLMELGIKRESIGDIVLNENKAYFACCKEISIYVENNFKTIGHTAIELKEVLVPITVKKEFIDKEFSLASLRLDVVVAGAYKISRNEAASIINNGLVSVNHILCLNLSYQVKEKDILSVKHKGRVYVRKIGGLTRSSKIVVTLGFLK